MVEQPAAQPIQVSGSFNVPKVKKRRGLLRFAAFIVLFGLAGGTWLYFAKAATTTGTWKMVWSDEFDGTTIDSSKWNIYTGELSYDQACYTNQQGANGNLQVASGTLIVRTKKEASTCGTAKPFTTGYIRSSAVDPNPSKYRISPTTSPSGLIKIEMRAQLPPTGVHGVWPGLWTRNEWGGTDPVANSTTPYGELDLMERWGDEKNNFTYEVTSWLGKKHTGGDTGYISNEKCPVPADNSVVQNNCDDVSTGMHTYAVEIDTSQSQVRYYFDGRLVTTHTANSSPGFDKTFWDNSLKGKWDLRIMNQVTKDPNDGTPPDSTFKTSETKVDYVRVYTYDNSTPPPADTTPPTANISAPTSGSQVSGQYKVTTTAADASGVARVDYFVDNVLQNGIDARVTPYVFNWDTTALKNGTHTLGAEAVDNAGNRSSRSVVSVTVNNPDTAPPTVSLTAPADGAQQLKGTINVTAEAADNKAVTNVQFYLDGVVITGADDSTAPYSYSWDTTKAKNGSHVVSVEAVDAAGNRSLRDSSSVTILNGDVTKPQPAGNVKATADAYNKVTVSWTAATDDVALQGYFLYRDDKLIALLDKSATSYSDTTTMANTKYSYYLIATDTSGNLSDKSVLATVTTPNPADTTAPTAPTNVTASAVSTSQINLAWSASTDAVGVTSYDVYRGTTKLVTVNGSVTSFGDSGLTAGTKYEYTVKAKDAAGNVSGASNVASATTQQASASTGGLTGRVTKVESGDAIGGAYISTYVNGKRTVARSNSRGYYLLVNLPVRTYTVKYYGSQQRNTQYISVIIEADLIKTVNVALTKK